MNTGAGQTLGTCWFFSSLNIFLTSDNGLKILWRKLQEVLPKLSARQRNYFNSNINTACPYKGSVKKTSAIYFWKFLNQYICAVGGPGRLLPKSGLNAYLTKNVKWRGESTRESGGQYGGGNPYLELPAILGHLGFKVGSEFRMLDFERWKYKFKNDNWTAPILMYRSKSALSRTDLTDLMLEKKGYELTGAIIYATSQGDGSAHVWACTIRNGKGYITDSNYPTLPKSLTWWKMDEVKEYFRTLPTYPQFRLGAAQFIAFDVILYTRKDYTNKIAPYCQLPQGGYRPMTSNNEAKLRMFQETFENVGLRFLKSGQVGAMHNMFSPRVLAEAIRRNANRPVANAKVFNTILKSAASYNNGLRNAWHATNARGLKYKINENGPNFKNFRNKLIVKFPRPFPDRMFMFILGNSQNNIDFVKRIKKHATTGGYTYPKERINAVLKTRQMTRAGAKRKRNFENERMYLLNGKNWMNANGSYVNVNLNNWVRTNSNAEMNRAIRFKFGNEPPKTIETFRRKTRDEV